MKKCLTLYVQSSGAPIGNIRFTAISDPVMHQGVEIEAYSERRPDMTSARTIDIGSCPTQN